MGEEDRGIEYDAQKRIQKNRARQFYLLILKSMCCEFKSMPGKLTQFCAAEAPMGQTHGGFNRFFLVNVGDFYKHATTMV